METLLWGAGQEFMKIDKGRDSVYFKKLSEMARNKGKMYRYFIQIGKNEAFY